MQRAVGLFWPRAESGIYREPKKLEAHGLAREHHGVRGAATAHPLHDHRQGRKALAKWIPTAGAGPVVEFEQLVKVFFAEQATKDDLLTTLARRSSLGRGPRRRHIRHPAGVPRRPRRLPSTSAVAHSCRRFLDDIEQAVDRWATWAIGVVEAWPDDLGQAEPDRDALEVMAANNDTLVARGRAVRVRATDGYVSVEIDVLSDELVGVGGVDPPRVVRAVARLAGAVRHHRDHLVGVVDEHRATGVTEARAADATRLARIVQRVQVPTARLVAVELHDA